ncbi:MAG: FAD-dependent oxidoreductase [Acidimicrobiia bacterium]|nr:FAD-dependent oxidoreductase [Acidimicrobiia bacterium]
MTDPGAVEVDLLVVGGGKAGKSLAMDRATAGWSVVMVERDKIGGTCINVACIPTKALVGSARTLLSARHAAQMGIVVSEPTVNLDLLRHHKASVVDGMVTAHEEMFTRSGMDFVLGTARFVSPRTVDITAADGRSRRVRGRDVVINTGTTPAVPDLPGIADARVWTSESILRLERIPTTLAIVGGGYIGCEFASMFATFGSRVTLLHSGSRLLTREDPEVAAAMAELLAEQGVDVRLGARAAGVHRSEGKGDVVVAVEGGSDLNVQEVRVATGRAPVTHASWSDFRVLRENLTGGDAVTTGRLVPYTVFTTPELARIDMTETEARARGHQVKMARLAAGAIPRSTTLHDDIGRWMAVVDADTDLILGAALFGHDAGEVISAVQMAMLGGVRYQQVRDAVITHPTMGEGLNLLFDTLDHR